MPSAFQLSRMRLNGAARVVCALACAVMAAGFTAARRHPRLRPVSAPAVIGRASYYGLHRAGRATASGTRFTPGGLTAASPNLPLGTKAKVTNLKNGRSVEVTVDDRGPAVGHRILDVSPKAANRLGMRKAGVTLVKVKPVAVPRTAR